MANPNPLPNIVANHAEWGRKGALQSAISRRAARARLAQLEALIPQALTQAKGSLSDNQHANNAKTQANLAILESHMARIDGMLAKEKTPKGMQMLSIARWRLFDQWAHLAGIPKPQDNREPGRRRHSSALPIMPAAIEVEPLPVTTAEPVESVG